MPSAQLTMLTTPSTKPKIGFSIDSIVGNRMKPSTIIADDYHEDSNEGAHENLPKLPSSPSDLRRDYSHLIKRSRDQLTSPSPPSTDSSESTRKVKRLSESSDQDIQNNNSSSARDSSPSQNAQKGPIMVPGIPASPFLHRSQMMAAQQQQQGHQHPVAYPHHEMTPGHPHFLQFQAAAALVHAHAAQTGFTGSMPQHLPPMHNPNMARESYPLYPWLLSRHGRIFPHRFPGSEF